MRWNIKENHVIGVQKGQTMRQWQWTVLYFGFAVQNAKGK